ncbi:MAG: glycosyltransferase family 2 protein [Candidatus Fermentithermobacillus carboniphilus]|uniref:Glycosyltransferase family 2 protein n=1 Tax=Candidatus Fermentithermobacillus carboniphilus TaxID=3085328 RepID=A0AAT9LDH5_9FIRM|nr:MAG: glycosyltransferase family 2 protein [Candidatus Fermentithermobacillus carboniphilus]
MSVVIPCRNERDHIEKCILSVLHNGYQGEVEVLVIDGMSDDGTRTRVEELRQLNPNVKMFDNPSRTTPQALNIGIRHASGEAIVIVGAHCFLEPGYIEKTTRWLFSAANIGCSGGRTIAIGEPGTLQELISKVIASPFGVGNATYRLATIGNDVIEVDTVAYGAYPRWIFTQVGEFDERLIRDQDMEFNSRLRKAGYKIILDPSAVIYYSPRRSLAAFWRQNFGNGLWNILTWHLVPGSLSWRHFVPLLFVTALITSGLLAMLVEQAEVLFFTAVGSYFFVDALETIRITTREKQLRFLGLFLVFPLLHISYGFGSLTGVFAVARNLLSWSSKPPRPRHNDYPG